MTRLTRKYILSLHVSGTLSATSEIACARSLSPSRGLTSKTVRGGSAPDEWSTKQSTVFNYGMHPIIPSDEFGSVAVLTWLDNQVHADASTFGQGVTKNEAYAQVLEQAQALFDGQRNWVSFVITIVNYLPY